MADALSRLPTGNESEMTELAGLLSSMPSKELFAFDANSDFPLNMSLIAEEQYADPQLQEALQNSTHEYCLENRDGVSLYVNCKHAGIYVPALLWASILQW